MSNTEKKTGIGQLLERLQEESWQLELLISGFAIFLVAASLDPLQDLMQEASVAAMGLEKRKLMTIPFMFMLASWFFLMTNLILHVILRGFWISAIGLRYISGDINFDQFRFTPKFDRFLRRRMPSFDLFIEQLEKLCSVVFAFTFILIFVLVSVALFTVFFVLLGDLVSATIMKYLPENVARGLQIFVAFTFAISAFIYCVDFITLGWIKRIKWLTPIYYPFYRFYSVVTLSFLYRPLYYNLIDNKFGRRVGFLIVPYMLILGSVASIETEGYLFFPARDTNSKIYGYHYEDEMSERNVISKPIIPSKIVDNDYLELFLPYKGDDDPVIKNICPGLEADKTIGTKVTMFEFSGFERHESPVDSLLLCMGMMKEVIIDDSLHQDLDYHFYTHPRNGEKGLLTIIDLDYLERGRHQLIVKNRKLEKSEQGDSTYFSTVADFPFWVQ